MKVRFLVIIVSIFLLSFISNTYADCPDIPLHCYAFCDDGPKQVDTKIGQCYATWSASCNPANCGRNVCYWARDNCKAVLDSKCILLKTTYYATDCTPSQF